eukprot:g16697.t1
MYEKPSQADDGLRTPEPLRCSGGRHQQLSSHLDLLRETAEDLLIGVFCVLKEPMTARAKDPWGSGVFGDGKEMPGCIRAAREHLDGAPEAPNRLASNFHMDFLTVGAKADQEGAKELCNLNASYVELPSLENLDAFARRVYCCLPFLLVTIVPFFAAFYALIPEASTVPWWVFLVGAGGWWLALLLRFPVILGSKAALKNNSNAQSLLQTITVLISGPAEEAIRIAFIFAFGWSLKVPHIFALGLGWTSLELLFTLVQCLATIQLLRGVQQGDAKAVEAFQVLAAQTGRSDPLSVDPFWGVLERCSAHLIHIAMCLGSRVQSGVRARGSEKT